MATPVFLPGELHVQRNSDGLNGLVGYIQSMGLQRAGHDRVTYTHTHTHTYTC